MVTVHGANNTNYKGLSTDTKPVGGANGDLFIEMDTSTSYLYDEQNAEWILYETDIDLTDAV